MNLFLKYIFNESTGPHNPDVLCAPSKYPVSWFVCWQISEKLSLEVLSYRCYFQGTVF